MTVATLPPPTDDQLLELITLLALNYGKPLDDEAALVALVRLWHEAIGGCSWTDIDEARKAQLRDESCRFFPDVGQFRSRVIAAASARHAQNRVLAGAPSVACSTCEDSGFLDAGTDDDGYLFVRECPKGCKPPPAHRSTFQRLSGGKRRFAPSEPQQLSLSAEALAAGIEGQHRATGDRDVDLASLPNKPGDVLPF